MENKTIAFNQGGTRQAKLGFANSDLPKRQFNTIIDCKHK